MRRFVVAVLSVAVGLAVARGQTPEQKKATIAYLQSLQAADGGFLPSKAEPKGDAEIKSSLRATSSAVRALKYFGGEPKDKASAAKFVEGCFDKESGGFADRPGGKPDVPTTAIGLMAALSLGLPAERYAPPVVKYLGENAKDFDQIRIAAAGLEAAGQKAPQADAWLEQVAKLRNADGTYGKGDGVPRETGSAVALVLRLGGKLEGREQVVKALKAGQRADGGFGKAGTKDSDLETTYRVMRSFVMLKEKPEAVERCREYVARCRNGDGGYGVAPGQASSVSGTYYASIVLHWLAEK